LVVKYILYTSYYPVNTFTHNIIKLLDLGKNVLLYGYVYVINIIKTIRTCIYTGHGN